ASDGGDALLGARIAAVLSEPGLGGNNVDLRDRLKGLDRDRSPRANDARRLAERWARAAGGGKGGAADVGALIAAAFPERSGRGARRARCCWPADAAPFWSPPNSLRASRGWRSPRSGAEMRATASGWPRQSIWATSRIGSRSRTG